MTTQEKYNLIANSKIDPLFDETYNDPLLREAWGLRAGDNHYPDIPLSTNDTLSALEEDLRDEKLLHYVVDCSISIPLVVNELKPYGLEKITLDKVMQNWINDNKEEFYRRISDCAPYVLNVMIP